MADDKLNRLLKPSGSIERPETERVTTSSAQIQAGMRGIIGRVSVDDGARSFGGWFVAVKRG